MLSKEDNALLTETGPGAPMGQLLRRYWLPAFLSSELPGPDCPPIQIPLLGEQLVAFRDSNGHVGLMDEHCAHRGTSLFYGRNEECGLRCIYHGWKYDVDGNVLDTPAEPADSTFKERIRQTAYPTHEAAGLVFAYMGPKEKQPQFPNYEWALADPASIQVTKSHQDCNYLQGVEGECDSTHLQFLHWTFSASGFMRDFYRREMLDYVTEQADFGMRLVAVRDGGNGDAYVRVSSFVMPVDCWVPARTGSVHFYVPAEDDTHSWRINMRMRVPEEQRSTSDRPFWDENYRKLQNIDNHYLQDRDAQKTVNFTGMGDVFVVHDSAATETMGPLYDRSKEHLGSSDRAVIAVRNYLLKTVRAFMNGEEPPNLVADPAKNRFSHVDVLNEVIHGTDWRAAFPHLTEHAGAEAPRTALAMSR